VPQKSLNQPVSIYVGYLYGSWNKKKWYNNCATNMLAPPWTYHFRRIFWRWNQVSFYQWDKLL